MPRGLLYRFLGLEMLMRFGALALIAFGKEIEVSPLDSIKMC